MPTCKATRKDGNPCTAQAQAGRDFCFFHDPDKAEEIQAAKVKGGQVGRATLEETTARPWRGIPADLLRMPLPGEVVELLAETIDDVRTGRVDPKVANAVGYLSGIILKVLEYDALNERLTALEEAVGTEGRRA